MKYLAEDGTIFECIDDCEEYERYQLGDGMITRNTIQNFVRLFDDNSNIIPFPTYEYCIDWWMNFHDIICCEAEYIEIEHNCPSSDWKKVCNFEYNEFGFALPKKSGFYKYNWDNQEWEEVPKEGNNNE